MEQTRGRFAGPPLTPRTAVIWSVLRAELDRRGDAELTVLDVGGGTGGFAVPLARGRAPGHRGRRQPRRARRADPPGRRGRGRRPGHAPCRATATRSPGWSSRPASTWCSATPCWRWSTTRRRWWPRWPPRCAPGRRQRAGRRPGRRRAEPGDERPPGRRRRAGRRPGRHRRAAGHPAPPLRRRRRRRAAAPPPGCGRGDPRGTRARRPAAGRRRRRPAGRPGRAGTGRSPPSPPYRDLAAQLHLFARRPA